MMRSSPTAGSANRSPVAATVDRGWQGVNSDLTQLSTDAERRGGQAVEALEERARDTALRNPKYAAEIERAIPIAKELEREVFAHLTFAPEDLAERLR